MPSQTNANTIQDFDSGLEQDQMLGAALTSHARAAIAERLGASLPEPSEHPALGRRGSTFVTLTLRGALRGCMGQLEATRPLRVDVRENALAAGFRDPRFPPLKVDEWASVQVEVSLIGPTNLIPCPTEAACLASLVPFKDGVILASNCHHATFLPQVWEKLPSPQDFLLQLKLKAGLRSGDWPADMMVGRYQVAKFHEPE